MPVVHAHTTGNDLDILEMSIPAEEARKAWGTTNPSMQNLGSTRETRDEYAAQLDGRASRTYPCAHFSYVDLSCKWYYRRHQHMRNISPDEPNKGIPKEEY